MQKIYRPCAGAVVFNRDKKILLGNRIDVAGNNWQFPQGGIEDNELPEDAARRELFEETSIKSVLFVDKQPTSICYDFPQDIQQKFQKRGIFTKGQNIIFSLFFFYGNNDEINIMTPHPEFKEYAWKDLDFAVNNIVEFKKEVYQQVAFCFEPLIEAYLKNHS